MPFLHLMGVNKFAAETKPPDFSLFCVFQCSLKERHISALKRVVKRCQNGYVSSPGYNFLLIYEKFKYLN